MMDASDFIAYPINTSPVLTTIKKYLCFQITADLIVEFFNESRRIFPFL